MFKLKEISPDYPRIPHASVLSNMTHDDIQFDGEVVFPIECWVQEKIDGSNMGFSWSGDAPVVRNRSHILKKGFIKTNTPAKKQFRSSWNWAHKHEKDIKKVFDLYQGEVTIYGEWMYYQHSLNYNRIPDWFIAYDIYSPYERKFLHPEDFEDLISQTKISYIKPYKIIFNSIQDIINESKKDSDYRDGSREGIVIKSPFMVKMVNSDFKRRDDFNTSDIIKNTINTSQ